MTAAAKINANPKKGHGLVARIVDPHFDALVRTAPAGMVPALVLLKPETFSGNGEGDRYVNYKMVRCEPLSGPDADNAMWQIESLYKARTSPSSQAQLPIALTGEQERRALLLEQIDAWADSNDLGDSEFAALWRSTFGIDPDDKDAANIAGVPGDYRLASTAALLQFAIEVGAESEPADDDNTGDGD